ncbi:uncharacterized protein TNCV_2118001 [Trichonephila clavipes]|nr:uncharacterized protein TNCV_2118001 [Trichonephila clavipes]
MRKGLGDGLVMQLPLSDPMEIYKDNLETDNRSNIGSELNFEIDLPGKRYRSTIYCLNLIKLYRRKPELANLVMENSSEGIDSETLYSVKLFMDLGFQEYLLDLGVNGMEQSNRTQPVVWFGRVNRYPYPHIKWESTTSSIVVNSHPLIVHEFLRSTNCNMTRARSHGAIVSCLNSGVTTARRVAIMVKESRCLIDNRRSLT